MFTKHAYLKYLIIVLPLLLPYKDSATKSLPYVPSYPAAIDVYQMASVIEMETGGEPERCQCLAGETLENRAAAQGLTIAESATVGLKRKKPSPKALEIARKIINQNHAHTFQFFYNPKTATDKGWLFKNRNKKKRRCGRQLFF